MKMGIVDRRPMGVSENEKIIRCYTKKILKLLGLLNKPGFEWNGSDAVVTGITYLDINNDR